MCVVRRGCAESRPDCDDHCMSACMLYFSNAMQHNSLSTHPKTHEIISRVTSWRLFRCCLECCRSKADCKLPSCKHGYKQVQQGGLQDTSSDTAALDMLAQLQTILGELVSIGTSATKGDATSSFYLLHAIRNLSVMNSSFGFKLPPICYKLLIERCVFLSSPVCECIKHLLY